MSNQNNDKILYTSLNPNISSTLNTKKVINDINTFTRKYIDRNNEVLYATSPMYRLFFRENERNYFFKIFNLETKDIEDLMKKIPTLDSSWKILNDTFFVLMTLCIQQLDMIKDHYNDFNEKKHITKKDAEIAESSCMLMLSFAMYSSLQYKYFRNPPNEDIMNYTINNLTNKFLLKQYGSIIKVIKHIAVVNHNKYVDLLYKHVDDGILKYIMNLRIRLNNMLKNIKAEYERNRTNRNYMSHEEENYDSEKYHINQSLSNRILEIASKVSISFSTTEIRLDLCKLVSKTNNCDGQVLFNALGNIKEEENKKVTELITKILEIYLNEYSLDSIKSKQFVVYTIQLYNKSNTKDKRIIDIKSILDTFLQLYCSRYSNAKKPQTKASYRKALFYYFILFIQMEV